MASNGLFSGRNLPNVVAPSGGVVSGMCYLIGVAFGVAQTTEAAGATFSMDVEGIFELPKLASDNVAAQALLYWDDTAKNLTTTAGSNKKVGYAAEASPATITTVRIRLTPTL